MYIPSWFLTAFTLSLPWSSVLRLWDIFYFEGQFLLVILIEPIHDTVKILLFKHRRQSVLQNKLGHTRNL
jgi:hypothetical protein